MAGWGPRRLALASLLIVFSFSQNPPADLPLLELVRKIADVQRDLPWFWSPPLEGMGEIPYTFHTLHRRRRLDQRDREVKLKKGEGGYYREWRSLQLERISDNGYTHTRCISQDGISPCAGWLVQALSKDSQKWSNFTAEEKAKVAGVRLARTQRRNEFWSAFPNAFRFERIGPEQIRFAPLSDASGIEGQLWFDPATFHLTRMEYTVLADKERLPKGSRFRIELSKSGDGRLLPARVVIHRGIPKAGQVEEDIAEYGNYRRFAVDSEIVF